MRAKVIFLLLVVMAIIIAGAFAPTFATALLDVRLLLAVSLVLLVWCIATFVMMRTWLSIRHAEPAVASVASGGAALAERTAADPAIVEGDETNHSEPSDLDGAEGGQHDD
jgi:small-conductance mechanosensitive channel